MRAKVDLELTFLDGVVERFPVGPGPTAVDLVPGLVAEPQRDGVLLMLSDASPGLHLEGGSAVLPYSSSLDLGQVRVGVGERPRELPSDKEGTSPLILIMVPLALGLVLWTMLGEDEGGFSTGAHPEAPELFAAEEPCPTDSGPTHHRAERYESIARAKLQRYPFNPQDGVQAAIYYQRAQACYLASSDQPAAQRTGRAAERAKARVSEDYHRRRFRLDRALEKQHYEDAWVEAQGIASLLEHQSGEYPTWIRTLERELRRMPAPHH